MGICVRQQFSITGNLNCYVVSFGTDTPDETLGHLWGTLGAPLGHLWGTFGTPVGHLGAPLGHIEQILFKITEEEEEEEEEEED